MGVWRVVRDAYRGALVMLLISAFGGLVAGSILGSMGAELQAVGGLLVMVPAFLAIRGSVYGSLGARLSSSLHQGLLEPVLRYDRRVASAMLAAVLNGVTASVFAAALTFVILTVLGQRVAPPWVLVWIAIVGGLLAGIVLATTIVVVVLESYRRGLDPDNLIGPTMTTAGDIVGMATLLLATRLALAVF